MDYLVLVDHVLCVKIRAIGSKTPIFVMPWTKIGVSKSQHIKFYLSEFEHVTHAKFGDAESKTPNFVTRFVIYNILS